MKITNITVYELRYDLKEPFYSASMYFDHRKALCIKIETDEGIFGWGEGGQFGPSAMPKAAIEHILAPMLIGEDPMEIEYLWYKMYNYTRDYGRKGGIIEAISAIDIALWDIKGKKLNCSVATLLGGYQRQQVAPYATGLYFKEGKPLDYYISEVERCTAQGFKAFKVKIGSNKSEFDLALLKSIKEKFGDDITLMTDANHAYNGYCAVKVGKELEKIGVLWFEEPVIPEDRKAYQELRQKLNLAIAGGECEYTHFGFKDVIQNKEVDIVQPDVSVSGGLTACKKIVDHAYINGILCIPHVWGSAVSMHAALQLIATIPMCPPVHSPIPGIQDTMFEFDSSENMLRTGIISNPECFDISNGNIEISKHVGLGLKIDEEKIQQYIISRVEIK